MRLDLTGERIRDIDGQHLESDRLLFVSYVTGHVSNHFYCTCSLRCTFFFLCILYDSQKLMTLIRI